MIERGLVGNPESSLVHGRSPKSINQSPNSWACPCQLRSGFSFFLHCSKDGVRVTSSPGQGGVSDAELPPHAGEADHPGPGETRAGSRVAVLKSDRRGYHKHMRPDKPLI